MLCNTCKHQVEYTEEDKTYYKCTRYNKIYPDSEGYIPKTCVVYVKCRTMSDPPKERQMHSNQQTFYKYEKKV